MLKKNPSPLLNVSYDVLFRVLNSRVKQKQDNLIDHIFLLFLYT